MPNNLKQIRSFERVGVGFALTVALCLPAVAAPADIKASMRQNFRPLWVTKNAPLYAQYLAMGDTMHMRHDETKAKHYWIASLRELEKNGANGQLSYFPKLEARLLTMYPDDWSKTKLSKKRELVQEEQVDILRRVNKLFQGYQASSGTSRALGNMADIGYKQAVADLEKTKADLEAKEQSQTN